MSWSHLIFEELWFSGTYLCFILIQNYSQKLYGWLCNCNSRILARTALQIPIPTCCYVFHRQTCNENKHSCCSSSFRQGWIQRHWLGKEQCPVHLNEVGFYIYIIYVYKYMSLYLNYGFRWIKKFILCPLNVQRSFLLNFANFRLCAMNFMKIQKCTLFTMFPNVVKVFPKFFHFQSNFHLENPS